jgi:hypothetical protein
MDMWTTQERCPHAHSLNNKYKSQTISQGLNRPQILRRRQKILRSPVIGRVSDCRCALDDDAGGLPGGRLFVCTSGII